MNEFMIIVIESSRSSSIQCLNLLKSRTAERHTKYRSMLHDKRNPQTPPMRFESEYNAMNSETGRKRRW